MPNVSAGGKGGKAGGKGGQAERAPGAGAGPRPGDWHCTICGTPGNRDWRARCRNCDSYRNKSMAKAMEAASKSQPAQPTFAERQLQQQRATQQQQRREESEKKRLREANARLAAEVAELKSKHAPTPQDGDEDADMEDGDDDAFETWSEEARTKRIELAKGGLAYAVEKHGDDSAEAEEFRREISTLQRASRQAKPFKAHRAQLERRKERLQKQQERDEGEISKAEAEMAALRTKVESLRAAVEERAKAVKEVTAELTELVRRSIAEGSEDAEDDAPPGPQADSPWQKMSAAIRGLEVLAGIPPELATLLARVQEAAVAMAAMSDSAAAASNGKAGGAGQPGNGQQAASASTSTKTAPAETPTVLAPHGRFGRSAAKAATTSPASAKPQPPQGAQGAEGSAQRGEADGGAANSETPGVGSGAAKIEATGGGTAAASDSGSELREEVGEEEDPMQIDLETSLAKLPEGDQRKLRAALQRGKNRGKGAGKGEAEDDGTRRNERERSPRPTKGGEGKDQ